MKDLRNRVCMRCAQPFLGSFNRSFCSETCRHDYRAAAGGVTSSRELTPGEVDRRLSQAVEMGCAPPWQRHPAPWTDVARSGA